MISDRLAETKDLLARLIAFPTVSDRSNLALIDSVADYFAAHGVATRRLPDPSGQKAALLATLGPERDGGVVLSGHTDVVPVEGQPWTTDPFAMREIDGKIFGRGAVDMKGFDACVLACVPDFLARRLKRPIHILLSYDEETTCLGSLDAIARFGADLPRPGLAIVGEPTMMKVADAHKGVATFQTRVIGVEGHSANPQIGASAIAAAGEIVAEICRLARAAEVPELCDPRFDPPYATFNVGMIQGGTARNILARECLIHWEFRGLPDYPTARAVEQVQRFIDEVALPRLRRYVSEPTIETMLEVDVPGLTPEENCPAATLAQRLARANQTIAVSFATEAGHFQQREIPTVICGPGSIEQAHKPNEFIAVSQLASCLEFMRGLADEMSRD